ncbi:hypothetical protein [Salinibacterium sp.]|uniref:hypothetical protein n=1 Tax=Salinibacterium sp. TaxID=1915057 RepID=UPI00286A3F40|nr:hypothetical protein [Salinibacterium sp.]
MHLLTINGSQFRLSTVEELIATKAALEVVALGGGGFVDVRAEGRNTVSVLVTPLSAIHIHNRDGGAAMAMASRPVDMAWLDDI